MDDILKEFELYVFSKDLKLDEITEDVINEYCTDIFYKVEDEEALEKLNEAEKVLREMYLGEE